MIPALPQWHWLTYMSSANHSEPLDFCFWIEVWRRQKAIVTGVLVWGVETPVQLRLPNRRQVLCLSWSWLSVEAWWKIHELCISIDMLHADDFFVLLVQIQTPNGDKFLFGRWLFLNPIAKLTVLLIYSFVDKTSGMRKSLHRFRSQVVMRTVSEATWNSSSEVNKAIVFCNELVELKM